MAVIDGKVLSAADLGRYLAYSLAGTESDEPASPSEIDQVKSRLFDNFVEEQLLLMEAERRGIRVSDAELDSYLAAPEGEGDAPPPQTAPDRATAVRDLTVRKLQDQLIVRQVEVSPEDIDAYLALHRDELRPRPRIVLRSISAASEDRAARIRSEIVRKKRTFDQALSAYASSRGEGQSQEVALDALPEPVREAVGSLKRGQVSRPVQLEGIWYVFQVESTAVERAADPRTLRALAEEQLRQQRIEEASRRLLEDLRRKARIELNPENLPFRYTPEPPP